MATKYAYWATSLIDGVEGSLDSIDGTDLNDQDMAIVAVVGDKFYLYSLDVDSAVAESSPDVIAPDANGGDKRWILHEVYANPAVKVPTAVDDDGVANQWSFDADYLYLCIATNSWKRIQYSTWLSPGVGNIGQPVGLLLAITYA